MRTIRLLFAALLPLVAWNDAPAEPKPLPWLLAQDRRMPTCELDGHKVPVGTSFCREGNVWRCSPSGTWENTRKAC
jgi:hypothetical protein